MWLLDKWLNKLRVCNVCEKEYWYEFEYPQGKNNYCSESCYHLSEECKVHLQEATRKEKARGENMLKKIFDPEEYRDKGLLKHLTGLKYQGVSLKTFSSPFVEFVTGILHYPEDFKISLKADCIKTGNHHISGNPYISLREARRLTNNGNGWFLLKEGETIDGISFSEEYPDHDMTYGGFYKEPMTLNGYTPKGGDVFWSNYRYTLLKHVMVDDIRNKVFVEKLLESEFIGASVIIEHIPSRDITEVPIKTSDQHYAGEKDWLSQKEVNYLLSDVLVEYIEAGSASLLLRKMIENHRSYIKEDICLSYFEEEVLLEAFRQNRKASSDIIKLVGGRLKEVRLLEEAANLEKEKLLRESDKKKKAIYRESKLNIYSQYKA
jgi:hypothetical protein